MTEELSPCADPVLQGVDCATPNTATLAQDAFQEGDVLHTPPGQEIIPAPAQADAQVAMFAAKFGASMIVSGHPCWMKMAAANVKSRDVVSSFAIP